MGGSGESPEVFSSFRRDFFPSSAYHWGMWRGRPQSLSKASRRRPPASAPLPLSGACDQEVSKRTLATLQKVCEEVSKKETRNHFEPRDVRVSLPRRADESSEVRSSGDNGPTSASRAVEVGEGRPGRLNASKESS